MGAGKEARKEWRHGAAGEQALGLYVFDRHTCRKPWSPRGGEIERTQYADVHEWQLVSTELLRQVPGLGPRGVLVEAPFAARMNVTATLHHVKNALATRHGHGPDCGSEHELLLKTPEMTCRSSELRRREMRRAITAFFVCLRGEDVAHSLTRCTPSTVQRILALRAPHLEGFNASLSAAARRQQPLVTRGRLPASVVWPCANHPPSTATPFARFAAKSLFRLSSSLRARITQSSHLAITSHRSSTSLSKRHQLMSNCCEAIRLDHRNSVWYSVTCIGVGHQWCPFTLPPQSSTAMEGRPWAKPERPQVASTSVICWTQSPASNRLVCNPVDAPNAPRYQPSEDPAPRSISL